MDPLLIASALGAAGAFFGGERRNAAQAEQASSANTFSAQQYATRYQTTVQDMQAAGLNPMLAYSQGAGSPPTGQQAQMSDSITPAVQSGTSAYLASLSGRKLDAEIKNIEADTAQKQALVPVHSATAAETTSRIPVNQANVDRIVQEVSASKTDQQRVAALTDNLRVQYSNLVKEGFNLTDIGNKLRATVDLLRKQTTNAGLQTALIALQTETEAAVRDKTRAQAGSAQQDERAGSAFGELGKTTGALEPFLRLIWNAFRR